MALALLVVGALMSGAGFYAVIYGYSIIQVEEGWASVISGTTLITGGVLTIALGLVLRALKQVNASLLPASIKADPEIPAPAADPPLSTLAEGAAGAAAVSPLETPALERGAHAEPAMEAHDDAETPEPPAPAPPIKGLGTAADVARPAPVPPPVPKSTPVPPPVLRADPVPPPLPGAPPTPAQPEFAEPRPADDYKLETPSTAEHDLAPADHHPSPEPTSEPESPAMDDWLDRAFAELDRDNPPLSRPLEPPPKKPAPEPVPRSSDLEPAIATPASHEAAEAPAPAASPDTNAAAPSAVIGRYESDGTTYVMYADGSIEAQSPAGVYRFSSMAELKSFIER